MNKNQLEKIEHIRMNDLLVSINYEKKVYPFSICSDLRDHFNVHRNGEIDRFLSEQIPKDMKDCIDFDSETSMFYVNCRTIYNVIYLIEQIMSFTELSISQKHLDQLEMEYVCYLSISQ